MNMHTLIALIVNGESTEVAFAPYKTLLEVLREDLNLPGTKHGCQLRRGGARPGCAPPPQGRPWGCWGGAGPSPAPTAAGSWAGAAPGRCCSTSSQFSRAW